jgi:hypothetical protein
MIDGVSELVDVLAVVGGGLLVSWWVSRRPPGPRTRRTRSR